MSSENAVFPRATGLLVIEVINSNPNGDPDRESDPRLRPDDRGEISPVSFKRKLRDLIDDKEGPVWSAMVEQFNPPLEASRFEILETRGRDRDKVIAQIQDKTFESTYWDARVFGNTFLEENLDSPIRTGVVQFGLGTSVAPVHVTRMTTTNKAGVEKDKTRGMAPLAYRVVEHGVYTMPFFVNPSAARKSGCTKQDIELLLKVIPFAYSHTASYVRSAVEIRQAWYIEHKSALGSVSDFELFHALTPEKLGNREMASSSWADYEPATKLPEILASKTSSVRELMAELYAAAGA